MRELILSRPFAFDLNQILFKNKQSRRNQFHDILPWSRAFYHLKYENSS